LVADTIQSRFSNSEADNFRRSPHGTFFNSLPRCGFGSAYPIVLPKPRATEDLGVDVSPRLKTLKVAEPPKRAAGVKVADVATLVEKLKAEAKVL
jgi:electron transfer flavoprotein beta subunit